jgi:hypothetical protein
MLEEREHRNYSHKTARAHIHAMKDFSVYFKRQPDELGPEHVREYQAYLLRDVAQNDLTGEPELW